MGRIEITAEVIEALLRAARDRGKVVFSWDTEVHGFGCPRQPPRRAFMGLPALDRGTRRKGCTDYFWEGSAPW